jgi:hypothetical protein
MAMRKRVGKVGNNFPLSTLGTKAAEMRARPLSGIHVLRRAQGVEFLAYDVTGINLYEIMELVVKDKERI